jgi:hypothetical protein
MFNWLFANLKSLFTIKSSEKESAKLINKSFIPLSENLNKSNSLLDNQIISEIPSSIIEKHWAKVEKILYEMLVNLANSKLNDDESLAFVFDKAYELMPTPIRLILPRNQFIQFCLNRKELILRKIPTYNALKKQQANKKTNQSQTVATLSNSDARNEFYESLLPELLALCITADGTPETSEKELALAIIENDDFITNKTQAFARLEQNIENLSAKRLKSMTIFKLQVANITAKIPQITQTEQKERIYIIVDGMLATVQEKGLVETKDITDRIKNKFNLS